VNLNPQKIQQYKIHTNVSVAIQDQPTTIEELALTSLCHFYMKLPFSVFFLTLSLLLLMAK